MGRSVDAQSQPRGNRDATLCQTGRKIMRIDQALRRRIAATYDSQANPSGFVQTLSLPRLINADRIQHQWGNFHMEQRLWVPGVTHSQDPPGGCLGTQPIPGLLFQ